MGAPELVTENAAAGHDRHDLPVVHIHKQYKADMCATKNVSQAIQGGKNCK